MTTPLSTAEAMAVAVLKGDMSAAYVLADMLLEQSGSGQGKAIPPVNKVTSDMGRLRVVLFFDPEGEIADPFSLHKACRDWLTGETPYLALVGCERVELYEFPEGKPATCAPKYPDVDFTPAIKGQP